MRIAPMAIWCHKLSLEEIIKVVKTEVQFTHGVEMVSNVAITYCVAIKELLSAPADPERRQKAYAAAVKTAKSLNCDDTLSYLQKAEIFATEKKIT